MSRRTREGSVDPSRRQALTQGLAATAAAMVGPACGLGPDRCAGGPLASPPHATLADVDALVVLMLENRSFDHMLGALRLDRGYPGAARIDGITGDESNLDAEGRPVFVGRMPGQGDGTMNPVHDFTSVRRTFNDGRNDGFVIANAGEHQAEVMAQLHRDHVPFLHALADEFTVCDRWFASYMGQTWPNRYYLHATTSHGRRENVPLGLDAPPTIWERLAERCYVGKNYAAGPVLWYTAAFPARAFSGNDALIPATIEEFFGDARRGNLPAFSLIDPSFRHSDFYPTHSLPLAEAFVAAVYRALAESPQWPRLLFVITFDEHGGYFDHVPPPTTADPRPDFRQLGFRVPALVIGPGVWRGQVISTPLEHVSIAATLRARFGVRSLGPRMDAAHDLGACLDPARVGAMRLPPSALPQVTLSGRAIRAALGQPTSQSEVERALAAHSVPDSHVDARSDEERLQSWLRIAHDLDVVKVVP